MTKKITKPTIGNALIIGAVLSVVLWLLLSPAKSSYTTINIDDIPHGKPLFIVKGGDTYIVFRIPPELQGKQLPRNTKKRKRVSDPPGRVQDSKEFRVFEVQSDYGGMLLPERSWWKYVIPCARMVYLNQPYIHDDEEIPGVLKCEESVSKTWENRLIYDLQGISLSSNLANLYSPVYRIENGQIQLGVSSNTDRQ